MLARTPPSPGLGVSVGRAVGTTASPGSVGGTLGSGTQPLTFLAGGSSTAPTCAAALLGAGGEVLPNTRVAGVVGFDPLDSPPGFGLETISLVGSVTSAGGTGRLAGAAGRSAP